MLGWVHLSVHTMIVKSHEVPQRMLCHRLCAVAMSPGSCRLPWHLGKENLYCQLGCLGGQQWPACRCINISVYYQGKGHQLIYLSRLFRPITCHLDASKMSKHGLRLYNVNN